jgi:beta-glucosidase
LPQLYNEGKISANRFESAVKKALTLKLKLGLFDKRIPLYKQGHINLDPLQSRETAYELGCQSLVMLKNNGILPLARSGRKIALVGPNANTFWCMVGDYTYQSMYFFWQGGEVDPTKPNIFTLKDALTNKGLHVCYERGCDWSNADESSILTDGDPRTKRLQMMLMKSKDPTDWNKSIALSDSCDIIIAALGENPTLCGEARSRKGIRLPGKQEQYLRDLIATGKPVVLVMFGGRPQVLGTLADSCAAILQAWYPGEEGGNAVADILLGNVNPSGKLCVSYPKTDKERPYCYNNNNNDNNIAYPFGYGLSYSEFDYSDFKMPRVVNIKKKVFEVSCTIENKGTMNGAEIVQLYVSPASSQPLKPIQLKGFARVNLKSGEKKRVKFFISPQQMSYFSNLVWRIDPGKYRVLIGASSNDIRLSGLCDFKGKSVSLSHLNKYLSHNNVISDE